MRGDNSRRGRRRLPGDNEAWLARRSTPTCVGTTFPEACTGPSLVGLSVHPHMRGDNNARTGPPPHAWGQLGRLGSSTGKLRSTPTCVGTTSRDPALRPLSSVHPHMRGDNDRSAVTQRRYRPVHPHMRGDNTQSVRASVGSISPAAIVGPPPHAWGQRNPRPDRSSLTSVRSTPTCVGTTSQPMPEVVTCVGTTAADGRSGPPPHAWGQLAENGGR